MSAHAGVTHAEARSCCSSVPMARPAAADDDETERVRGVG
jgi:hypothetical protein